MLQNKRLSRHISDVCWGQILWQLAYKTGWTEGSVLALTGRFEPSSKTCSSCGVVKAKLRLDERVFTCEACGLVADRDVNAAVNLAKLALAEAKSQGRTDIIIAPVTAQVTRGATDLENRRRKRRGGQATAKNRTQDPPENRHAA